MEIPVKFDYSMSCIIQSFAYLMATNNKDYCYPSQGKILEILKEHYNVEISLRSLNYKLKYLEEKGYIHRIRRIKKDRLGRITYNSTIYRFARKAFKIIKNAFFNVQSTMKKFYRFWNSCCMRTKVKNVEPKYLEDGRLDISPYCKILKEVL